jgi:hypothetical protein
MTFLFFHDYKSSRFLIPGSFQSLAGAGLACKFAFPMVSKASCGRILPEFQENQFEN